MSAVLVDAADPLKVTFNAEVAPATRRLPGQHCCGPGHDRGTPDPIPHRYPHVRPDGHC
jgi:hypothetical protein